jgi:hypothetical protein
MRRALATAAPLAALAGGYVLTVRGDLTLDLRIGRRQRPLGPIEVTIAAPREVVFDVIEGPYVRTPRALRDKLEVLERTPDMVLAAHYTPVGRLTTTTLETVRFKRPSAVAFRLVRGPVPHVLERYDLTGTPDGTRLRYTGELGADLWGLGRWWADRVAGPWERAVESSLAEVRAEAERRTGPGADAAGPDS